MSENKFADWQPGRYLKFKDLRTQPASDLAARIEVAHPARVIDLGCGPGNSTAVLRDRWPGAELTGIDTSAAMLEKAREAMPEINWQQRDLGGDLSDLGKFDVVFSNAVLQWVEDVDRAIPAVFNLLNPGGALAFQIPYSGELPSHRAMKELVAKWDFPGSIPQPTYRNCSRYYEILSKLTDRITLWETTYIQILGSHADIVEWNKGSALRPYLNALPDDPLREQFLTEYEELIRQAYPVERNSSVLYPFTRIFAVAYR